MINYLIAENMVYGNNPFGGFDMTDRQKLELRQSVIRGRLAELGTAEGTAEIDTLAVEYGSNEARIRAFMVAGDEP